jgi:hypothetical protein
VSPAINRRQRINLVKANQIGAYTVPFTAYLTGAWHYCPAFFRNPAPSAQRRAHHRSFRTVSELLEYERVVAEHLPRGSRRLLKIILEDNAVRAFPARNRLTASFMRKWHPS